MPVQACTKNSQPGHKWGEQGFCYTGLGSEKKALAQGQAIEASKQKRDAYYDYLNEVKSHGKG